MKKLTLIVLGALMLIPVAANAQWDSLHTMKKAVLYRLNQPDQRKFPDSVLVDYCMEGLQRVCVDVGAYRGKDTIITDRGQAEYAANADAIEGWPVIVYEYNDDFSGAKWWGIPFVPISRWSESSGESKEIMFSGFVHAGEIVVHPAPIDSGGSMYLLYRAYHRRITDDTMTIQIDPTDMPGAISYAAYRAASDATWPSKAAEQWEQYQWHVQNRQRDMVSLGMPMPPEETP